MMIRLPVLSKEELGERGYRAWGQANALWALSRGARSESTRRDYLTAWFAMCETMLEEWQKRRDYLQSH